MINCTFFFKSGNESTIFPYEFVDSPITKRLEAKSLTLFTKNPPCYSEFLSIILVNEFVSSAGGLDIFVD